MPVTFILGNKSCKRAWKFLLKTLPTTVCTEISFEIFDVLWQSTIFNSSTSFCSFENFYKYIQFCLLVYIICLIQISPLTTWISCRDDVAWFFNFFFFFTFLTPVVIGIVYKDLHDVLITDQPFRTMTGATRWGYLLQFLNQMPLPSKIHQKRNSRGWTYKYPKFFKILLKDN